MQAAHTRAEGLQRDNLSLKSQLNMLTEQLQASNGGTDNGSRTPEVTPGSVAGSSWCMSGSSGQSSGADPPSNFSSGAQAGAATEVTKMKALRSGESMDARSQKSDHLTGDEMDMLGAGASGLKGSSSPNLRDHSPIKPRNGADSAQRLNRYVILSHSMYLSIPVNQHPAYVHTSYGNIRTEPAITAVSI